MLVYPEQLKAGDTVAVVAPSSGVPPELFWRLDLAIARLRTRGLDVREGALLRELPDGGQASPKERADELMHALVDDSVSAVIPPWGGELAIELLDHMDFELLQRSKPKWLIGFSDLSTLQLPLLLRSGWASIHGPNLMQLHLDPVDAVTAHVFEAWGWHKGSRSLQRSSPSSAPRLLYDSTSRVQFSGRLVGGCIDSASRLAGSPYGDVAGFAASQLEGTVVFLENAELRPYELARALTGLRLAGWFDNANGILIGRDAAATPTPDGPFSARDAVERSLGGLDCPVLLDVDVGHVDPQWSLCQGAVAEVCWDNGQVTIHQHLD